MRYYTYYIATIKRPRFWRKRWVAYVAEYRDTSTTPLRTVSDITGKKKPRFKVYANTLSELKSELNNLDKTWYVSHATKDWYK